MSKQLYRHAVCVLLVCMCVGFVHAQTLPTYSNVATLNYNGESVYYAILADLNGDGLSDVIGCFKGSSSDDIVAWYQNSSNTFPTMTYLASAHGCAFMAVGDLNDDNAPDLIAMDSSGNYTALISTAGSLAKATGALAGGPQEAMYVQNEELFLSGSGNALKWSGGRLTPGANYGISVPSFSNGGFALGPQVSSASPLTLIGAFDGGFQVSGFSLMAGSGSSGYDFNTASNYGPGAMPDWSTYWNLQMRAPVAPFWACVPVEINIGGSVSCISYGESTNNSQGANYYIYYIVDSGPSNSDTSGSSPVALPGFSFSILPSPSTYVQGSTGGGPARGLFNVFPWNVGNGPDDFVVANGDGNLYAALHTGRGTWTGPQLLVTIPKGQYIFDARSGGTNLPHYFLTSDFINPNPTAAQFLYGTNIKVWTAPPLSKPTTTTVTTSGSSVYVTASVTFTATVAPASGAGTPIGTVTFYADGNSIGSAALSNGQASITNNTLSVGNHQITASYAGSGVFLTSTSPAITQTITQVPTGLNVNINPTPGYVTQNVNVSVGVSAANGSTPIGTVSIVADGSNNLGFPTLSGGVATVSTSSLSLGTHSIAVSYPGNSTYDNSSTTKAEQVVQIPTTTALSLSSNSVSYGTNVTFTATVTSSFGTPSGTVTFMAGSTPIGTATLNAGGVATVANNTLTVNTYTVTASYSGSTNFATSSGTNNLTVHTAPVQINWNPPAPIVYGTPLSSSQLNATATFFGIPVPGTYAYTPASGAVLSAGTQTLNVVFTPTDTVDYSGASTSVQLVVNKAKPVITWATPTPITYGTALGGMQLNASATVPGTLVYSPASGTGLGAGMRTLNVTFTPTDTANYNSGSDSVQLVINKATPVITWPTPAAITYGTPISATQLDATVSFGGSSVPGTLVYSPASGTVLGAGMHTLNVIFTPTDSADYNTVTQTTQIQVIKANPVLTWNTPAPITFGEALSSLQLNAVASGVGGVSLPGQPVYTPASGDVLTAGTQTLSVSFTPIDTLDYNTASATVQLLVNKATVRIKWLIPAPINFGTPLSVTQLDASAGLSQGTFVYSPASGAILTAGMHTLNTIFTPTDTTDYTTGTAEVQLQVNKLTPTIIWGNPAPITYGTALSGTQLDASANVPGTFVYSPASGSTLNAGLQKLTVTLTPSDTADYTTGTANVPLTVNKATPTLSLVSSSNPGVYKSAVTFTATISNGLAGTVTFFDGSSAIGTAVLSGNIASVATSSLMVGIHSITARWDGNANFNPVISAPVQQAVKDLVPTITWNNPSPIVYGTPLSGVQLDATASTTGTFVYSPALGAILTAGSHQLNVTFTPTDTADYAVQTASVNIVVEKATPVINWPTPAAIPAGTPLSSTQLNATANVPGTFVYNPGAGTVLPVGTQQLNVAFTPSDTANYTTTNSSVPINVVNFTISVGLQATAPSSGALSATAMAANTPKAENVTVVFGSGDPFNIPLTLTPLSGFTGEVQLSCEGVPETMACNFAQPTVNITSGAVTTNLSITTQGRSVTYSAALYLGLLALGLGFRRRVRKSLAVYCPAIILCVAAFFNGMIGCGGMNYTQFDGTPKGTYTITVVAASNSLINTAKVTVTVQ
jgi:hypothetical protein